MKRRTFLGAVVASLAGGLNRTARAVTNFGKSRIAVIGAGAFGSWTALYLQRSGARVTLIDTFGPGHPLPSSGGATRVIRLGYADRVYVNMARRAMELWREHGERWPVSRV